MKSSPLKRWVSIALATGGLTLGGADLVLAQRGAETSKQHSPARSSIKNVATTQGLEVVARLPERPQAAVTLPSGRIIYVLHRTAQSPVKLLELLSNGRSANSELSERGLGNRVERYGNKGSAGDGILVDVAGNVYNSDMPASGIGVINGNGQYRLLLQDKKLFSFPDTLAVGYDGFIYGTATQAHRSTFYQPQDQGTPPYYIYRFKPLAPVTANHQVLKMTLSKG